ncbi:MAG: transcription termination/antitermination NusG family protein, partial [Polynucleobacter sp.]|nr:transcription termination/antitermination NusG family protein [Polynucleobacter sp.]
MATNPQATGNMRWYVIHAYSGMEKSVKKGLEERIARSGMAEKFGRILVPSEEVVENKTVQKTVSERR